MQTLAWLRNAAQSRPRLVAGLAALAVFSAVLVLARMAATPPMALLYAGLEPGAAGEVVRALDQRGIAYEVRGDAVHVPAAQRDELRMTLAAEGLPAAGSAGYELLDRLSGFGTTAQMFDAAYWRAKEGELARTIAAGPRIASARVHIATAAAQPFRRDQRPSASVTAIGAGGGLGPGQARAIRHLVAAAVPGLAPEDVTVIDGASGLVVAADDGALPGSGGDRAQELRRNVERLLEARVGRGRAVVEVSVETLVETESLVERRIDPERRVAIVADTEERSTSSSEARDAGVTVASNLPEGDAGAGAGASRSQSAETRSRTTWDVSETRREVTRGPGGLRRLTVAVLLDGVRPADGTGPATPRPEAELEALRELVASAVGYDPARGDVITIRSLPFEGLPEAGSLAGPPSFLDRLDAMALIQLAALVLVAVVLGLFVLRPLLLQGGRAARSEGLAGLPAPAPRGLPATAGPVLTGEIDDGLLPATLSVVGRSEADDPGAPASARKPGDPSAPEAEDPVARLRRLIAERQEETVEILRGWMEEREEKA